MGRGFWITSPKGEKEVGVRGAASRRRVRPLRERVMRVIVVCDARGLAKLSSVGVGVELGTGCELWTRELAPGLLQIFSGPERRGFVCRGLGRRVGCR